MTAPIPDPLVIWGETRALSTQTLLAFGVSPRKFRKRPVLLYPTPLGIDRIRYTDGDRPKYGWAKKGGKPHWYGLDQAVHTDRTGPIYVVNGEISVWAAYQAGVAAVCTCSGESAIPADDTLARLIRVGRPIRVVFDNDESGRTGSRRLACALFELGADAESRNIATWLDQSAQGAEVGKETAKGFDVDDLHQIVGSRLPDILEALEIMPLERPDRPTPIASSHWHLAEIVRERMNGRGRPPIVFDEQKFWQYQPALGVYSELKPASIAREVGELDGYIYGHTGEKANRIRVTSTTIAGVIKCAGYQTTVDQYFDSAPVGLQFTDGFFSWESLQIEVSAPELRQRICVGVSYDPKANCGMWKRALSDWFGDDSEGQAKCRLLQEFAGACLFGAAPMLESVLFLVGPGGDGKSQCLDVLTGMAPPDAVCAVSPQSFSRYDSPYYVARLAGKLINAVADIPPDEIVSTSELKAAITGDPIEGRRPRGEPFTFRPRAGHIFSANELPGTLDQTPGFWRRMLVLRFGRKFDGVPIRQLGQKILKNERQGLFAWAIEGARRVRLGGSYSTHPSISAEVARWRHDSDQVSVFLAEEALADDSEPDWTSAAHMFSRYKSWASRSGHGQLSSTKFGKRAKLLVKSRRVGTGIEYAVTMRAPPP